MSGTSWTRTFGALGAATALISLVVACTQAAPAPASPTPAVTPSATPTAPAATPSPETNPAAVHTSQRHAYSLVFPESGWNVVERPGQWPLGETFTGDRRGVDVIYSPDLGYRHDLLINSQPVPAGMTFDEWVGDYDAAGARAFPHCERQGDFETASVDGEPARIGNYLCNADRWVEVLWFHGQRAYAFRVGENRSSPVAIDPRAEADLWLERLRLNQP
ncbi:MAG: hypothetical protein M3N29_05910 [Chloroflexota bacterium]|nr:hypothetical protein [Chloroflexota bacterium]